MNNKIKEIYETEYRFDTLQIFSGYERNRLLARVVPGYVRPGMKVLDLACNDGVAADYFQSLGAEAYCLDISERALAMAASRGLKNLVVGDVEDSLPYTDGFFDMVFWGDNAEHLFFPGRTLAEIRRVLKDDGVLIMSTPNMGWFPNRIYYMLTGMPRRTEGHRQPAWKWEHIRFFNKKVVRAFLHEYGFEIEKLYATDRRRIFEFLSRFSPALMGSIFLVIARKKAQ